MVDTVRDRTQISGSSVAIAIVSVGLGILLLLVGLLTSLALQNLHGLKTAASDNVQWTLTQTEVEYLALIDAAHHAHEHLENGYAETDEIKVVLGDLRTRFDIFFSRINMLHTGRLFQVVNEIPEFGLALANVRAFLETTVARIDGTDENLGMAVPDIVIQAEDVRRDVRKISVRGQAFFATQAEERRENLAQTLQSLMLLVAVLFISLLAASVYLLVVIRRAHRRGDELALSNDRLEQANRRMNTILLTSLDAMIVTDAEGRVLEFNPAAEQLFRVPATAVQGRAIGDIIVPPELRGAHEAGMSRIRTGGERRVTGKGRVVLEAIRADGERFPVELAIQSASDGNREIFIGFIRDISRRVAIQNQLIEARDQALAGEKAKAEFLTVMSHEIRTPLNGILGNLALLDSTKLSAEQARFVRNMEISGRVLKGHVDSVLDIASLEAGKMPFVTEPVNLAALLQDIIDSQSGSAAARGNVMEWLWARPSPKWVSSDPWRLQQVILNLVGNAIKFTENGRISIDAELLPVSESDADGRRVLVIRVNDNGIGIPADRIDKVFDDFQTSDATFHRTTGGTGLGLGIARRLVEAMGGKIGANSKPGVGSTFWVRIPVDLAEPFVGVAGTAADPEPGNSLDVLVVEDNEINQEVIKTMLEKLGHRTVCVADGRSGVDHAMARRYDLVLMDISMPVMDGIEATRRIRNSGGASAQAPIFAVSANVLRQDTDRFLGAGMNGFIGKPLNFDALRELLQRIVRPATSAALSAPPSGHDLVDPEQLSALRVQIGDDGLAPLLQRFVAECDDLVADLSANALSGADLPETGARCHKVAGSAAMFGATGCRMILLDMEKAALAGDLDRVTGDVALLAVTWRNTRAVLGR